MVLAISQTARFILTLWGLVPGVRVPFGLRCRRCADRAPLALVRLQSAQGRRGAPQRQLRDLVRLGCSAPLHSNKISQPWIGIQLKKWFRGYG